MIIAYGARVYLAIYFLAVDNIRSGRESQGAGVIVEFMKDWGWEDYC